MPQWFALRVKSHFEKAVALAARQKGFDQFLPLYECGRQGSYGSKGVGLPLFPGYVFCRFDPEKRLPLLTIPGVLHVVGIGKIPAPIEETEIAALQSVARSGLRIEPWPFLEGGRRIRLGSGPLGGLKGFLVQDQTKSWVVVNLPVLKRAIAIEVEDHWIEPLNTGGPVNWAATATRSLS